MGPILHIVSKKQWIIKFQPCDIILVESNKIFSMECNREVEIPFPGSVTQLELEFVEEKD